MENVMNITLKRPLNVSIYETASIAIMYLNNLSCIYVSEAKLFTGRCS